MANILTHPAVLALLAGGTGYLEGMASERKDMRQYERDLALAQLGIEGKKELVTHKDETQGAQSLRANRDARTAESAAKTVGRNLSNERALNYQPQNFAEQSKASLGQQLVDIKNQEKDIKKRLADKTKAETAADKRLTGQKAKALERAAFINNIPLYKESLKKGYIDENKLGSILDALDLWDDPTVFKNLLPETEIGKEYRARKMRGMNTTDTPTFSGFEDAGTTTDGQSPPAEVPLGLQGSPFQMGANVTIGGGSPLGVEEAPAGTAPQLGVEQAQWPPELDSQDIAELTQYAAKKGRSIATTQDRQRVYSEAVAELQSRGQ